MRVAFTSSDGRNVDRHFGKAEQFHVWEIGPERAEAVGTVSAITRSGDEDDRILARATAIADCAIVYTMEIGGPAAAKLVARRIHPMKTGAEVPVAELVTKLQGVLRGKPPPWLRKAMGAPRPAAEGVEPGTAGPGGRRGAHHRTEKKRGPQLSRP
jgi:nitrogen fixation protein NifX